MLATIECISFLKDPRALDGVSLERALKSVFANPLNDQSPDRAVKHVGVALHGHRLVVSVDDLSTLADSHALLLELAGDDRTKVRCERTVWSNHGAVYLDTKGSRALTSLPFIHEDCNYQVAPLAGLGALESLVEGYRAAAVVPPEIHQASKSKDQCRAFALARASTLNAALPRTENRHGSLSLPN